MRDAAERRVTNGHASSEIVQEGLARFAGGASMTKQKHIESVKLDAANLPVRRSGRKGERSLAIAGEWRTCTVDQIKANDDRAIAIGPFGSRMKADRYVAGSVPVIRRNNIPNTRTLVGDLLFVSDETADEREAEGVSPSVPQTRQPPSALLLHLSIGPNNSEPRTHNSELPQAGEVISHVERGILRGKNRDSQLPSPTYS